MVAGTTLPLAEGGRWRLLESIGEGLEPIGAGLEPDGLTGSGDGDGGGTGWEGGGGLDVLVDLGGLVGGSVRSRYRSDCGDEWRGRRGRGEWRWGVWGRRCRDRTSELQP